MTADVLSCVETLGFASRARTGALAAPVEAENPTLDGAGTSGWLDAGSGSADALGRIFVEAIGAADLGIDGGAVGLGSAFMDSVDSADSVIALEADAPKFVCGACFGVAIFAVATGAAVRGVAPLGTTSTGLAGAGALAAGFCCAAVAAGADFAVSFLRSSPRATRNVPFACSTLIGLVRTKFAPIRKAFATPACPSTTATASDELLLGELRALLNSNVAFCSLSQSTTTASKCSPINFFTAAKGSVQGTTVKSNSLRTCVTVRAVFSSGQKRRAW